MQRFLFSLLLASSVFLISCNNQSNTEEKIVNNITITEEEQAVVTSQEENLTIATIVDTPIYIQNEKQFIDLIATDNDIRNWQYKGSLPCVIDFYATWCQPCKMMDPLYQQLAKEYAGKIFFYKVDVDKLKDLCIRWNIQGMPTFIFCNSKTTMTLLGAQSEEQLRQQLDRLIQ